MGEQGEVGVIHGAQDAAGLLLAGQVEMTVDRCHHQVKLLEQAVGEIEGTVFQDVHLDAFEQADALQRFVQAVDLLHLLHEALGIEAMGDGKAR